MGHTFVQGEYLRVDVKQSNVSFESHYYNLQTKEVRVMCKSIVKQTLLA